jgi:hypothetical protein
VQSAGQTLRQTLGTLLRQAAARTTMPPGSVICSGTSPGLSSASAVVPGGAAGFSSGSSQRLRRLRLVADSSPAPASGGGAPSAAPSAASSVDGPQRLRRLRGRSPATSGKKLAPVGEQNRTFGSYLAAIYSTLACTPGSVGFVMPLGHGFATEHSEKQPAWRVCLAML